MKPILLLLVALLLVACTDQSKEAWARRLEVDEGLAAPAFVAKYRLDQFPHREGNIAGLMAVQVFFLPDCDLILTGELDDSGGLSRMAKPVLAPRTTSVEQRLREWDHGTAPGPEAAP